MAMGTAGQLLGSVFITFLLYLKINLAFMHVIMGITIVTAVMIYSIGIKGGRYFVHKEKRNEDDFTDTRHEEKFLPKLKQALITIYGNGWLLVSVTISTLAKADYYLVTIVLALFIKSFDQTPEDLHTSNQLANIYQDLFFGLSFVGNLLYGLVLDRINTINIIFPTLLMAIFGYSLGIFAHSRDSILIPIMILFAGAAMPGLLNSANYIAIKNFPRELRGILNSVLNVIGVAGYLFLSVIGGHLFDNYGRSAPFILFIFMLLGSMIVITYIYKKRHLKGKKKKDEFTKENLEEVRIIESN